MSKMNIYMKPTSIAKLIIKIILLVKNFKCPKIFFPPNGSIKKKSCLFGFTSLCCHLLVKFQLQNLRMQGVFW